MQAVDKQIPGKNALWVAYKNADSLLRNEIVLELKKVNLYRYLWETASKEGYDLPNAKTGLVKVFVRLMPETAPLFGLPAQPKHTAKKIKPSSVPGTLPLFDKV